MGGASGRGGSDRRVAASAPEIDRTRRPLGRREENARPQEGAGLAGGQRR